MSESRRVTNVWWNGEGKMCFHLGNVRTKQNRYHYEDGKWQNEDNFILYDRVYLPQGTRLDNLLIFQLRGINVEIDKDNWWNCPFDRSLCTRNGRAILARLSKLIEQPTQ